MNTTCRSDGSSRRPYAAELRQDDQPEDGLEVRRRPTFTWPHRERRDDAASRSSMRSATPWRSPTRSSRATASKIVVPGAGFLLNNEMGDFNAGPGLTNEAGPDRHGAEPRRARQAHAVEHVADDSREGRQAVHGDRQRPAAARSSTPCLMTILDVVDFGMNAQEAVDAAAVPSSVAARPAHLREIRVLAGHRRRTAAPMGHTAPDTDGDQGVAQVIVVNDKDGMLEGGTDHRAPDGAAVGARPAGQPVRR